MFIFYIIFTFVEINRGSGKTTNVLDTQVYVFYIVNVKLKNLNFVYILLVLTIRFIHNMVYFTEPQGFQNCLIIFIHKGVN